ncbi:hypothetical protein KP509_11G064300 [Ceratopteris richardii]|uniref:Protein kinase domain-containing protein n=1 Tax=Ceratopteris richardii TaxID=49495 RepID=A0A8T2TVM5_CERRI|nr:hypothetical protein KP509_11G064300 [Ceratopteris richardii]
MGEDLSWFQYEKKDAATSGGLICRTLQTLCKKAVLGYGRSLNCFWKASKTGASEDSWNPWRLNRSCSSRRSVETRNSHLQRSGSSMKQNPKKVFGRVTSWSQYLENGSGKDDGVNISKDHTTDLSELFLGQKFASGTHSRLYHAFYKQQAVAVKLIMPPTEDEALAIRLDQQFSQEVALLSRLRHPNIVQFVSACKNPPVFCVIMEYLPGGSLKNFLHKSEPYSLSIELVISIALDTASGMEYLHSEGIIHRDLKSDNLVMTEDLRVKVADFGVSCLETHKEDMKGYTGTYRWMAPEMIKGKLCSRKVDVFSFGIVLWELLTGLTPYSDMTPVQAAFAVCQKNARPAIPPHCPRVMAKLMKKCWSTNPSNRPEFSEVVKVLEDFRMKSK